MIYTFKRVGGMLAMMLVELLLFVLFLLFYLDIVWVSWDSANALYVLLGLVPIFLLTLGVFLKNKSVLTKVIASPNFVEAKLIDKKQIGMFHRKILIWTYEYSNQKERTRKSYWSTVEIRKINRGDSFVLAIDEKHSYFPIVKNDSMKSEM